MTDNAHGKWVTWGTEEAIIDMAQRFFAIPGFTKEKAEALARERQSSRHGQPAVGRPHCNYCGSLHPDAFMEAIEKGYPMEVADWKYGWPHKVYVTWPTPDPTEKRLVGSTSVGSTRDPEDENRRIKTQEEGPEGFPIWDDESGWSREGTYETIQTKFYTEHLETWKPLERLEVRAAIAGALHIEFFVKDGKLHWRRIVV